MRTPEHLALGWRDALLARDAAAFAGLFAHEGVMLDVEHRTNDLSDVRPLEGRSEIEATTRTWFERTPSFEYEILDLIADSRRAAKLWRYTVASDSTESEFEGATWLTCANGEILTAHVYFDSYRLVDAMQRLA